MIGRYRVWPNGPAAHTRRTAHRIRMDFGFGGANFPGARELYEAAEKIEEWAKEWDEQQQRSQRRYFEWVYERGGYA